MMFVNFFKKMKLPLSYIWLIAIAAYLLVAATQAVVKNYQTQKLTKDLEEKLADAQLDKQRLEALIVYYKTDSFKEKELRRALLLTKPNEKVYALPESYNPKSLDQLAVVVREDSVVQEGARKSNYLQWIEYLTK